jgi:putative lumazine-binding protein
MSSSTDESDIRQAINSYSEGMRTANVGSLKNAFHDQAILCGYLGDELITAPIEGLYEWVDSNPPPDFYNCLVLDVEITNRVAAAKIRETDSHGDVTDYFHLLKVDDRWWIVSKVWDAEVA